jgi:hypothetical protein
MLTEIELERRKPVWIALADLWRDTELQECDLRYIAKIMKQSGYTLNQLRDIYLYEIAPVVYRNLLSPAGEWAGFDQNWLVSTIEQHIHQRTPSKNLMLRIKKPLMTYATQTYWQQLERMFKE